MDTRLQGVARKVHALLMDFGVDLSIVLLGVTSVDTIHDLRPRRHLLSQSAAFSCGGAWQVDCVMALPSSPRVGVHVSSAVGTASGFVIISIAATAAVNASTGGSF